MVDSLANAVYNLRGDCDEIPWQVRLFENPQSFLALPGAIDLFGHDCLHILLDRGLSSEDEAYVLGFTMGNDPNTRPGHLAIFKFLSQYFYPAPYNFTEKDLEVFDRGFRRGRGHLVEYLNRYDFATVAMLPALDVKKQLGF